MHRIPSRLASLTAILLAVALTSPRPPLARADQAVVVDPRALALSQSDLSAEYQPDLSQSVFTDLPGGGQLTITVFRRPADGTGPVMVRNTVNSMSDPAAAQAYYARLPSILSQQGFTSAGAAPIGAESAIYSAPDTLDGRPVVYSTVAYRLDSYVVLTTMIGPANPTVLQQVSALA